MTSQVPPSVLLLADVAKIVVGKKAYKYGETCNELGYDLIPFAIETYGKFGKVAIKHVKHLKVMQTMALEEGVRCEVWQKWQQQMERPEKEAREKEKKEANEVEEAMEKARMLESFADAPD